LKTTKGAAGRIPALQHGTKGSQRTRNGSSRNGQWRRAALLGSKLVEPHPSLARDLRAAGRQARTAQTEEGGRNGTGPGNRREWRIRDRRGFPEILGPGSGLGEETEEAVVGGMERETEGWGERVCGGGGGRDDDAPVRCARLISARRCHRPVGPIPGRGGVWALRLNWSDGDARN
jgi:hypothetical protein